MTPRDAAALLICSASSGELKNSPALIERPGGLVSSPGKWALGFLTLPELLQLPDSHTFIDGVSALIAAAASGSMQAAAESLEQGPVDLLHDVVPALNIEVSVYGPTPRGAILIEETIVDDQGGHRRYRDHYESRFYSDRPTQNASGNLAWFDVSRPKELDSDLRTSATFSHRTLAAIGQLLSAAQK
jgi:hypothetical protein